MKKILLLFFILSLLFGFSGTAKATPYEDFYGQNVWFGAGIDMYTWNFDLDDDVLAQGDINPQDQILSALLTVRIYDVTDSSYEFADFFLDGSYGANNLEVNEQSYIFDVYSRVFDDHFLSLTITRESGDFGVDFAKVSGEYSAAPVPEPATLLLLGTGLIGLAGYGRKKLLKRG